MDQPVNGGGLNAFYRELVEGIRAVESGVPLVVETGLYATPRVYQGRLRYPGPVRRAEAGETLEVDAAWIRRFLALVRQRMRDSGVGPAPCRWFGI